MDRTKDGARAEGSNSLTPSHETGFRGNPPSDWKKVSAASSAKEEKKKSYPKRIGLEDGASDEARTRYLHLGKVALYQMSYTRINKGYYSISSKNVKNKNEKI